MNAAFLLVTTSWLAAAEPVPVAPLAPAPHACVGGHCGAACDACCDTCCEPSCKRSWFSGFNFNMFNRCKKADCCDCCEPTCCEPAHCSKGSCGAACCEPICNDCCEPKCKRSWFSGFSFFSRKKDCCEPCCDDCHGCANGSCGPIHGAPVHGAPAIAAPGAPAIAVPAVPAAPMPKAGEAIPAPKEGGKIGAAAPAIDLNPAAVKLEGDVKSPFELSRRYESRVDRAPDYSWLTGQLHYVHADGGLWLLRYAPLWKEDPNGGSVVLARDTHMDSYREGDLVTVQGEILNQQRSSVFVGAPLYRASSIRLVDRQAAAE